MVIILSECGGVRGRSHAVPYDRGRMREALSPGHPERLIATGRSSVPTCMAGWPAACVGDSAMPSLDGVADAVTHTQPVSQ